MTMTKQLIAFTLLTLTTTLVGCEKKPKNDQIEAAIRKDLAPAGIEVKQVTGFKCKGSRNEGTYICGADVDAAYQGKEQKQRLAVAFMTANGEWFQKSHVRGALGDE